MPENLDDIRSALLVIGKALGVGFTVPPTNVAEDESILKPDGDRHYDRAEVIEIQLERIPPVEISNSNIDSMRDMFNRTHENYKAKWPKSLGTRYEASIENIASMPIFTWVFDSKLVNPRIELREYGYDENGYPYQLSQQHRNDLPWVSTCWTESLAIVSVGHPLRCRQIQCTVLNIAQDGFSHVVNHPPWRGQRFGKEWFVGSAIYITSDQCHLLTFISQGSFHLKKTCIPSSSLSRISSSMISSAPIMDHPMDSLCRLHPQARYCRALLPNRPSGHIHNSWPRDGPKSFLVPPNLLLSIERVFSCNTIFVYSLCIGFWRLMSSKLCHVSMAPCP